jgi:hypothetical protein
MGVGGWSVLAFCLALAGCGGPNDCAGAAVLPLSITVVDSATSQKLCDATVTIDTSDYHREQQSCPYQGGDGPGTYNITVVKGGYASVTQSNVVVAAPSSDCEQAHSDVTIKLTSTTKT